MKTKWALISYCAALVACSLVCWQILAPLDADPPILGELPDPLFVSLYVAIAVGLQAGLLFILLTNARRLRWISVVTAVVVTVAAFAMIAANNYFWLGTNERILRAYESRTALGWLVRHGWGLYDLASASTIPFAVSAWCVAFLNQCVVTGKRTFLVKPGMTRLAAESTLRDQSTSEGCYFQ